LMLTWKKSWCLVGYS